MLCETFRSPYQGLVRRRGSADQIDHMLVIAKFNLSSGRKTGSDIVRRWTPLCDRSKFNDSFCMEVFEHYLNQIPVIAWTTSAHDHYCTVMNYIQHAAACAFPLDDVVPKFFCKGLGSGFSLLSPVAQCNLLNG